MKIIEGMIQGSPQWRAYRKSKITATDAAPAMGLSPYKTALQLWQEKLGLVPEPVQNERMAEGQRLEPIARAEVSQLLGIELQPLVVELGYLGASLDGISHDCKTVVEIKCSNKVYDQAREGFIPDYYRCQMFHQMAICDVDKVFYYAFNGSSGILLELCRDDVFIKAMLEAEKRFYDCLQNLEMPEPTERDYTLRDSNEWFNTAVFYRDAKQEVQKWEAAEKFYRDKLIELSEGVNSKGHGVKLTKVISKGRVDYNAIPELIGLDLTMYRKKNIESYRISLD